MKSRFIFHFAMSAWVVIASGQAAAKPPTIYYENEDDYLRSLSAQANNDSNLTSQYEENLAALHSQTGFTNPTSNYDNNIELQQLSEIKAQQIEEAGLISERAELINAINSQGVAPIVTASDNNAINLPAITVSSDEQRQILNDFARARSPLNQQ